MWQEQKIRLDQMLEFQLFLRDAKNVDAMSSAHEVCMCRRMQGIVALTVVLCVCTCVSPRLYIHVVCVYVCVVVVYTYVCVSEGVMCV